MSVYEVAPDCRYYVDDKIARVLDKKRELVSSKDRDFFFIIDGDEGCLTKGSKVLLSNGEWKNVEDIKLDDEIISPQEDGTNSFNKIIKLFKFKAKNVYDVCELHKQKKKLYTCSHNHEIPLYVKNRKTKKWEIKHYKAEELYKESKRRKDITHNTTSPSSFAIENYSGREDCKIEPYTLGVWLGDGHFTNNNYKAKGYRGKAKISYKGYWKNWNGRKIWVNPRVVNRTSDYWLGKFGLRNSRALAITSMNPEIIEEVSKFYPIMDVRIKDGTPAKSYAFSLNGELSKLLNFYGLEGKLSGEKFIPKEAMLSNIGYRKKLLAGLIDTDGYLSKSCSYSISSKSKRLAQDILSLVYSLGGRGSIRQIKKKIKSIGFEGTYYNISFYLGSLALPIKVERKLRTQKTFYLSASRTSISLRKKKAAMVYGFTVDSPSHWFVTDNNMITKNSGKSYLAFQCAKYLDPTFNLDRVCMTPQEFLKVVQDSSKAQAVVYDEAYTGMASRRSMSEVNNMLTETIFECRKKNLFVFIVLPSIFFLDRTIVLHRGRVLFHTYFVNEQRGYFSVYTKNQLKILFDKGKKTISYSVTSPIYRTRFYGRFALDKKGEEIQAQAYDKKKIDSVKDKTLGVGGGMNKIQEKQTNQRDLAFYLLIHKYNFSRKDLHTALEKFGCPIGERRMFEILEGSKRFFAMDL